jgi:hypothetical protein
VIPHSNLSLIRAISSSVTIHHFLVYHPTKSFAGIAYTEPKIALWDSLLISSLVPERIFHLSPINSPLPSLSVAVRAIVVREGAWRFHGYRINDLFAVKLMPSLVSKTVPCLSVNWTGKVL